MFTRGNRLNRGASRWYARRAHIEAFVLLALIALAAWTVTLASAGPDSMRLVYATGKIVPIPASVPHEAGDMVDSRIVPDLRWLAARYPIYVTDGYSGPLPDGEHVGCDNCHVKGSDHYNGVAVDLVPLHGGTICDASWKPITRLALWAEPEQNKPIPPFRWVGYNGDEGHGCGNHLHLSWNHAPAARYALAEWVETFPTGETEEAGKPRHKKAPQPKPPPPGPEGGVSVFQSGGLSPRGD
ncbi:MAG TPA: hypothetical protein VII45_05180 [Solirubrobacterales bacterium]